MFFWGLLAATVSPVALNLSNIIVYFFTKVKHYFTFFVFFLFFSKSIFQVIDFIEYFFLKKINIFSFYCLRARFFIFLFSFF